MDESIKPTVVRAKMTANVVKKEDGSTHINLYGVYSDVPGSENKAFSDATPGLNFNMVIAKDKPAAAMFENGGVYYADFTRADK